MKPGKMDKMGKAGGFKMILIILSMDDAVTRSSLSDNKDVRSGQTNNGWDENNRHIRKD